MEQYPKWFLALNFPNVVIAMVLMIFYMFGGIHPFGDVDNWFYSFIIYIFNQLLWISPIVLFFVSIFSWGWCRERLAIYTAIAAWVINIISILIVVNA